MTLRVLEPEPDGGGQPLIGRLLSLTALRLKAGGARAPVLDLLADTPADAEGAELEGRLAREAGAIIALLGDRSGHRNDPLVRLAASYGLSALELDLLTFALDNGVGCQGGG